VQEAKLLQTKRSAVYHRTKGEDEEKERWRGARPYDKCLRRWGVARGYFTKRKKADSGILSTGSRAQRGGLKRRGNEKTGETKKGTGKGSKGEPKMRRGRVDNIHTGD